VKILSIECSLQRIFRKALENDELMRDLHWPTFQELLQVRLVPKSTLLGILVVGLSNKAVYPSCIRANIVKALKAQPLEIR